MEYWPPKLESGKSEIEGDVSLTCSLVPTRGGLMTVQKSLAGLGLAEWMNLLSDVTPRAREPPTWPAEFQSGGC